MNKIDEGVREIIDKITLVIFGQTLTEALENGTCIDCKEEALPKCYSGAGIEEYKISGICEECFDEAVE